MPKNCQIGSSRRRNSLTSQSPHQDSPQTEFSIIPAGIREIPHSLLPSSVLLYFPVLPYFLPMFASLQRFDLDKIGTKFGSVAQPRRGTHRLLFIPPTGKRIVLFSFSFYRKKLLGIVCFDSGRDTWQVFVGRRDSCSLAVTQLRVTASATMYPIDSLNSTGSCNNSDDDARSLVHRAALRSIVRRKRDRSETRDR